MSGSAFLLGATIGGILVGGSVVQAHREGEERDIRQWERSGGLRRRHLHAVDDSSSASGGDKTTWREYTQALPPAGGSMQASGSGTGMGGFVGASGSAWSSSASMDRRSGAGDTTAPRHAGGGLFDRLMEPAHSRDEARANIVRGFKYAEGDSASLGATITGPHSPREGAGGAASSSRLRQAIAPMER